MFAQMSLQNVTCNFVCMMATFIYFAVTCFAYTIAFHHFTCGLVQGHFLNYRKDERLQRKQQQVP